MREACSGSERGSPVLWRGFGGGVGGGFEYGGGVLWVVGKVGCLR